MFIKIKLSWRSLSNCTFASKQVEFPFPELIIDTQEKIRNMFKLTIRKPKQRQWTSFMVINFEQISYTALVLQNC